MSLRHRLVCLCVLAFAPSQLLAEPAPVVNAMLRTAGLQIVADKPGQATVSLTVVFISRPGAIAATPLGQALDESLPKALEKSLGRLVSGKIENHIKEEEAYWSISGQCDLFAKHGLLREGRINFTPVFKALRLILVRTVIVTLVAPEVPIAHLSGGLKETVTGRSRYFHSQYDLQTAEPSVIELANGYRPIDLLTILIIEVVAALGLSVLCRLPFTWSLDGTAWYVAGAAVLMTCFALTPVFRYRDAVE